MEHFLGRVASKVFGHPDGSYRFLPGFLALQVPGIVEKWRLGWVRSGQGTLRRETQAEDLAWAVSQ